MKIALLLTFVAHLGVSLAGQDQIIETGAEKTVPELIAIYESLVGGIVPDSLLARRHRPRSVSGAHQGLTDGYVAGGLWPNDGSVSGGLEHTFDSVGDRPFKDLIPEGLNSPDSSPDDYSFGARDQGSIEGFVSGDSQSHDGRTTGGLPYVLHSVGAGRLSPEGFIAGGRDSRDGFSHGGLLYSGNPVGGDLGSPERFGAGGSNSRDGRTTGGVPNVLHSVGAGHQSSEAGGRKPQDNSSHGGLSADEDSTAGGNKHVPTDYSIGEGLSSNGLVAGGRKGNDGSTTGGPAHTYDSVGGGLFSSDASTSTGLGVNIPNHGLVGDGSKYTDGSVAGGLGLRDGPAVGGRAFTGHAVGDGLVSANGLTIKDTSLAARQDPEDAFYGSKETSEAGKLSPRMKEKINQIKTAFMIAVSPNYDGLNNSHLWKALIRKQKILETSKLQLQHMLYIKRERLRKLHGIPLKYHMPSKALTTAIIRDIENIVAYRPADYSSP